ncbi:MAG: LapA family protein [Lysobacter sp.]|nr:LapA family protein [Lysobacter sp.]
MRPLRAFVAFLFLALGVVVGALNPGLASVDLGVWRLEAALGVVLIGAVLCGVLLGGLAVVIAVVLPLRRALRTSPAAADPVTGDPAPAAAPTLSPSEH